MKGNNSSIQSQAFPVHFLKFKTNNSAFFPYYCNVKKQRKEKHFIKKPVYPGGQKALNAFIREHLKYPKDALEQGIEGSVYIRYSIGIKGDVVQTQVISSLGHGCDEEAERLVKLLRFDVDKVFRARVLYHKKIRVWFKRPKQSAPKAEVKTQINYQLTSTKKKSKITPSGFSYTITLK